MSILVSNCLRDAVNSLRFEHAILCDGDCFYAIIDNS